MVDYKAENLQESSNHFKKFYKLIQSINPDAMINIFFHKYDRVSSTEDTSSELWRVFIENIKGDMDKNMTNKGTTSELKYFLTR